MKVIFSGIVIISVDSCAVKTLRLLYQTSVIVRPAIRTTHREHDPWAGGKAVSTRTAPVASHCLTPKRNIIV